nr:hypothetical protein BaRGS_034068 [Batillaria attramentaria]
MAACVRWYTLDFLPLRQVRRMRVLACCPLFFNKDGKAVPGSPYQRSLLWESDVRLTDWTTEEHKMGSDDLIMLYKLPGDLLLATWKADGEIAFIAAGLHYDQLVKRSLLGKSSECYVPKERKVISDDIDPWYGLHGYTATVELRNMRQSLWSQQFTNLHCRSHDIGAGKACFSLIRHDCVTDHTPVPKKMTMPWRTELFKGVVQMAAWLDVTVLDERGEVFYATSSPVQAKKPPVTGADLEYEEDHHLEISQVSDRATVTMELGQLDHGKIFVRHLQLNLSLSAINEWFGTKY